jgi:predicted MPP superfamily phosphohydrolase
MGRRRFLRGAGLTLAGAALAAWGGHHYVTALEPERLSIERVGLPFPGLAPALEGTRIVLLSDFHLQPYTQLPLIEQAVDWVNYMAPDLLVLGGDYVLEDVEAVYDLAPVLGRLNARYGVFAIMGNHDAAQWIGSDIVAAALRQAGLVTLIDEAVTLGIGAGQLYLMGLDDGWFSPPNPGHLLYGCPSGALPVVALHEPDPADDIAALGRVALQLSGHTHGGQVRLPGLGAPYSRPWAKRTTRPVPRRRYVALYTRGIAYGPPCASTATPKLPRSRSWPAPNRRSAAGLLPATARAAA